MYHEFGLTPYTTVSQAKAIIKNYNQLRKKHLLITAQQIGSLKRLNRIKLDEKIYLTVEFQKKFEDQILTDSFGSARHKVRIKKTIENLFEMLNTIKVLPYDYKIKSSKIIDYFIGKQYSLSYCYDIISLLNKWGAFLSKNTGIRFEVFGKIPPAAKNKIRESQELKGKTVRRTSLPLTKEILKAVHNKILLSSDQETNLKYYRYLILCFGFALRPKEADDFIKDSRAKILIHDDGMKYLEIEQTKLFATTEERRIKRIPFINKYQLEIEKFFDDKKNNFLRPTPFWIDSFCKDLEKNYKAIEVYTNYAPRKGYVDHAKYDQSLISIARQMGHLDISTTYESYKDKTGIDYDENDISKKIKDESNVVELRKKKTAS